MTLQIIKDENGTLSKVDATILDIINPLKPKADALSCLLGNGVWALAAWVGRGYRDSKTFSL